MKKKCLLILIFSLFLFKMYAGTYICYVYKGTIGKDSVSFYFQLTRRFSDIKNVDLAAYAVVSFVKNNQPLYFKGIIYKKDNAVDLKYDNQKEIKFTFTNQDKIRGCYFSDGNSKHELVLTKTGKMIDTLYKGKVSPVDILMSASTPNYYLLATYEKNESPYSAQMQKLKIFNKSTNKLFQEIDFTSIPTQTGNVISVIFNNVQIVDYNKDGYDDILIWNKYEKMGSAMYAVFNPAKQKFDLLPELSPYQNKK